MKRIFLYIFCVVLCVSAQAQTADEIARYVEQRADLCQTQPDSLFTTIRQLEKMRAEATDSVAWAFLSELLYNTYSNFLPNVQHDAEGDKLEEWGRTQWQTAADACLRDILRPVNALHRAKVADWMPLITQIKSVKRPDVRTSVWFDDDVLHVFHLTHPTLEVARFYAANLGGNAAIYAAWRAQGDIDSLLCAADADPHIADNLKIRLYYDKITRCDNADPLLSQEARDSAVISEQVRLCNECLSRFKSADANGIIRNFVSNLRQPDLQVEWPKLVYPDADYLVPVRYRNIQGIEVSIGKATYTLPTCDGSPYHYVTDTLRFRAPQKGTYKVVVRPRTREKNVVGRTPQREAQMVVSALRLLHLGEPNETGVFKVVDAMSGEEQKGHRVVIEDDSLRPQHVKTVRIEGEPQEPVQINLWGYFNSSHRRTVTTKIYTDRAIYRPGDKVYVTVCRYEQCHWDAKVLSGDSVCVELFDHQHKLIATECMVTAANGCCGTSFSLPKDVKTGMCYLRVGHDSKAIRVEEYKRPTFELALPDSLQALMTLTARNYNGTPLRGACVVARVQRMSGWWRNMKDAVESVDTLTTDAHGQVVIPVDTTCSRQWQNVVLTATVTAASGETHDISRTYWLHHDPEPASQSDVQAKPACAFRCVRDIISKDSAAVIEVESQFDTVHLFVSVFCQGKLIDDRQVTFGGQVLRLEFADSLLKDCQEADGLGVSLACMREGKMYAQSFQLRREQPDNKLRWVWDSFRDRVTPGDTEVWTGRLFTPDGKPADASAIFCLYDASLDLFGRNVWNMDVFRGYNIFSGHYASLYRPAMSALHCGFDIKSWRGVSFYDLEFNSQVMNVLNVWRSVKFFRPQMAASGVYTKGGNDAVVMYDCAAPSAQDKCENESVADTPTDEGDIAAAVRENFQETAYYSHSLSTDKDGRIMLSFTLPDAVTTWRLLGVAHTNDMMTTSIEAEAVAQKTLMAMVSVPRFYRRGDETWAAVTVQNLSHDKRNVRLSVDVLDAATERKIKKRCIARMFTLQSDTTIHLRIDATDDVIVRAKVTDGEHTDGEQRLVPMLDDDAWTTRSTDISCSGIGTHRFAVDSLFVTTDRERRVTVTYTESPIWTAIDVMRNLQEPAFCDVVSLHTSVYANVLLKYLSEKYDAVGRYLDYDAAAQDTKIADLRSRLAALETSDGGYSWMPGMEGCEWLTREVATTFARLKMMTGTEMPELDRAIAFLSMKERERVEEMKRDTLRMMSFSDIQYLYVRAIAGRDTLSKHDRYLMKRLRKLLADNHLRMTREQMALVTLVLEHLGDTGEAERVRTRLRQFLVPDGKNGVSFSYLRGSFTSIDRKLLDHVYAMEALSSGDTLLPAMRRHLLRQKRVQAWDNPLVNASAVYALLIQQPDVQDAHDRLLIDGRQTLSVVDGYAKSTFTGLSKMKTIAVEKQGEQESWGAVYVESRQRLEDIQSVSDGLGVKLYVDGDTCRVGDKVQLRVILHADMDYECVHLSVGRAAATEPVAITSGYCYQGGLAYYREVRDASDELFIGHLPKGDYVLLLPAYAVSRGNNAVGIARAECMYAPEFCGNSKSQRIVVK